MKRTHLEEAEQNKNVQKICIFLLFSKKTKHDVKSNEKIQENKKKTRSGLRAVGSNYEGDQPVQKTTDVKPHTRYYNSFCFVIRESKMNFVNFNL